MENIPIRTISSHVPSIATNTTDDVGSEVLLLRAVVLSMTNLSAVLACLVLIVTKSTVKSSKFTELIALELILSFGNRGSLATVSFDLFMGRENLRFQ